jgi:hypothetical protein
MLAGMSTGILKGYYAATALFLLLDYGFGINIRVAFLDSLPGFRAAYYGILVVCAVLVFRRPAWAAAIGAVESSTVIIGLVLHMGVRAMIVTDDMLQSGSGVITVAEVVNFVIAGGFAYVTWHRSISALSENLGRGLVFRDRGR